MVLDGTNDVDDDNRGIFVEDERWGRVEISWDAFERVTFDRPGPSGPAYDDFPAGKPLRGQVTTRDGKVHKGRLAYDLDESETWEQLGGERRDIDYNIPLFMIASVIPESRDSSRLVLKNGKEVELEDSADVGDGNAGIAVVTGTGRDDVVHVRWEDVRRVDFD
jgi:hypothetical protein